MSYSVKEIFFTLQGEGANTGRAAVFCRFAGCNLWSGREEDRAQAVCKFCDTDFVGTDGTLGGRYAGADELATAIAATWAGPAGGEQRLVVLTGGEPLLQVDGPLIDALHRQGFRIAVETNGTLEAPQGLDWICVSPKAGAPLRQRRGSELKVVVPQAQVSLQELQQLPFEHFFVQPMDGPDIRRNTEWAIAWCKDNPRWRLSVQTHKMLGIR